MVKHYNTKYFTAKVNGEELEFVCYTTYTRVGFCHTAHLMGWKYDTTDSKQTYYNRTWERFDYETVQSANSLLIFRKRSTPKSLRARRLKRKKWPKICSTPSRPFTMA